MSVNEVKTLLGHEFKVVKNGLAEEQVVAFVNDLITERDHLFERQQHINSLQILAEKTVTEANQLAEQIRREAQMEAGKIIKEVKADAKEIIIEAQRQAQDKAQEEVERILAKTTQEASAIIELTRKQASSEIKEVRDRFVPRPENLTGEIITTKKEAKESMIGREKENELEALFPVVKHLPERFAAIDSPNASVMLPWSLTDSPVFEGEAKIAVVPPVDTSQLKRLRQKLEDLSYLKILRTDGCWDEGYIITAHIFRPLPVINMLRGMAEVEKAQL